MTLNVATQYRVNEQNVTDAYYKLMRPEAQIKSYIEDALRSSVPKLTLDELFEKKMKLHLKCNIKWLKKCQLMVTLLLKH